MREPGLSRAEIPALIGTGRATARRIHEDGHAGRRRRTVILDLGAELWVARHVPG